MFKFNENSERPLLKAYIYSQPHQRKHIKNSGINFLYALLELLIEKGLLTTEKLDDRKRQVAERIVCGIATETMNTKLS